MTVRNAPVCTAFPAGFLVAAVLFAVALTNAAWAQSAPLPDPQASPAPLAPQPAPANVEPENPGLINEIGKLLRSPALTLPALPAIKSPGETFDDLNARARGATDSLPRLTTMIKGRMVCPVAANGAPDCKAASDRLCQSKGYKEGKSLDTDSARSCSAKSLLAGGTPAEGECKTENFVTRALCQ